MNIFRRIQLYWFRIFQSKNVRETWDELEEALCIQQQIDMDEKGLGMNGK
jgi:hypothetical protein